MISNLPAQLGYSVARGHTPHWKLSPGSAVHSPILTVFLTLCPVWRKEFSSILPVLNIMPVLDPNSMFGRSSMAKVPVWPAHDSTVSMVVLSSSA